MCSSEDGPAFEPGEADSGIWAFASTKMGLLSPAIARPSHTAPLLGQNSLSGTFKLSSNPSVFCAARSRYSTYRSALSGDSHSIDSLFLSAPDLRRAERINSGRLLTAI